MSLSDGDPAPDGDVWFRIATQRDHIKQGRVHHAAFGGQAISSPAPEKGRPWARELSGRLRSRAGSLQDIEHAANDFCAAETARGGGTKTFNGVIYVSVADAKQTYEAILTTGVHFTPRQDDTAHADLTFHGWLLNESKEEKERFQIWLSGKLQGLYTAQLHHLPDAHIPPKSAASRLINFATSCIARIRQRFNF
jgi:hypothetical protein